MITPGMRAYTIGVGDVNGGGGHVLPGDRVDVLLARTVPGSEEQQNIESDVVLQNVRILGINLNADQTTTNKANPKNATLEVTVEDAGRLSIASQVGALSLALRRTGAAEVEPVRAVRVSDLRPYGAPPTFQPVARQASAPPPPRAEPQPKAGGLVVVNGTHRATTTSGAGA